MIGTVPPSALHAAPVTYEARSEHRNAITAAISSGSASLPSGRPAPTASSTSSRRLAGALALLVGEAARAQPRIRGGGARRHGVAADPVLRVEVGDQPRQRQHRRLGHRVVGHRRRGSLRRRGGDVDDHPFPPLPHRGDDGPNRPDEAHHVQLPELFPLPIRDLEEVRLSGGRPHYLLVQLPARPRARPGRAVLPVRRGRPRSATTASFAPVSRRAASARAESRPVTTTSAPSSTSSRAVASPIPPVEPVTTQTRPRSPRSIGLRYPA